MLISANVALLVFLSLVAIAAAVAIYMGNYKVFDDSRIHSFVVVLAGLGVFVTFLFYYNLVQVSFQQQELASMQEVARINDSILDHIFRSLDKSATIIPYFIYTITPLTSLACGRTKPEPDKETPEACTAKTTLSYRIFSIWQDAITTNNLLNNDPLPYVTSFLQPASSEELLMMWKASYLNFTGVAQEFGNLLFEYAAKVKENTPEAYIDTAKALIADERFKRPN